MELVEGEDLSQRIARGAIPLDEALPIAKQMAEALEAAHEQGIIHRDLKPANIKVRTDGTVKVLDFGLAKAMESSPAAAGLTRSPTLSLAATHAGVILGTAAYMSPEQAKGRPTDTRTDVWAFGCVLYEMLTGRRAFPGDEVTEVLASVIKSEPDWDALPPNLSPGLRLCLRRSLDKTLKGRLHAVADMRLALEGAFDVPFGEAARASADASPRRGWRRSLPWMAAAFFLGGSTAAAVVWRLTLPDPPRLTRLAITAPATQPLATANSSQDLAVSPDGANVVYWTGRAGAGVLVVRPLNQLSRVVLQTGNAFGPFVSADSTSVGFSEDRTLKRISILGGPPATICSVQGQVRGASWGADGTIVFGGELGGLWRVSASGGEPEQITKVDSTRGEQSHSWPNILPGGRAVVFTIVLVTGGIETAQSALLNLDTGQRRTLITGGSYPRYAPTGHLVYAIDGTLRAVGFDLERLEVTTPPVPLLEGVVTKSSGAADFAFAADGTLVYIPGSADRESERTVAWVDQAGREEPVPGLSASNSRSVRLSPDGRHLAIDSGQPRDIWTYDIARGTRTKITTDAADDQYPLWTLNGQRIVFTSNRGGRQELYSQKADGSDVAERLFPITEGTDSILTGTWSRDGTKLLFSGTGIGAVTMAGDRKVERLMPSQSSEGAPTMSPDGGWMAYMSQRSGRFEVYVERYPQLGDRQQLSRDGGWAPRWSPDGHALYYLSLDGTSLFSVPISIQSQLTPGAAKFCSKERSP
jgi:eukaryotic-like serine/threonine-protein kinase